MKTKPIPKKSVKKKSVKRKSSKRKSVKRKSVKRKSVKRKSSKRKSVKRKSSKRKSSKRNSSKRKSSKRKSSKRKSSNRKSSKKKSVKRKSVKRKSSKRKSVKRKSSKKKSVKRKSVNESKIYLNKIIVVNGNEYVIEKKMGSGSYGSVFLVNRNNEKYTIKIILLRIHEYDKENIEKTILNKLQNNCSKYFLCIVDSDVKDNTVYIVTKYIPDYIDLYHLLKNYKIDIEYKIRIAQDLLKGLENMHNLGVIHRDIKLDNILVKTPEGKIQDGSYIKYIDYGFSCLSPNNNIDDVFTKICYNRTVGTLEYFSPELARNWLYLTSYKDSLENFKKLDFDDWKKCDLWALGILLYILFVMKSPYKIDKIDDEELLEQILYTTGFENPRPFLHIDKFFKLPEHIKNIVKNLLYINPNKRSIKI